MKKLMIFVDWFVPGFKAGGQLRSCANLAAAMQGFFDIYVVTSDRDSGEREAYPGITLNKWMKSDAGYHTIYLSPDKQNSKTYQALIASIDPECIYLNSMFSFRFTIVPLLACRRNKFRKKIVLAPRGMLHEGALQYKPLKKKAFLHLFRAVGIHKRITFHATDATEQKDIHLVFGASAMSVLVDDFPATSLAPYVSFEKNRGELKCLFISRISPKKNLDYFLRLLNGFKENILLSVIGPYEDEEYLKTCQALAEKLPANINVVFRGAIPNQQLPEFYHEHHLFVLPTHGENFGHVIYDSFVNGRPVLISDLTPWRNLEKQNAGWDIPLKDHVEYKNALQTVIEWDQTAFDQAGIASWQYARDYISGLHINDQYLKMFS